MRTDYMVVGAGITGITVARVLAEAGKSVLVIEQRNHIGGNCYDEYDDHGILIHRYGPHLFHTNHGEVWDFLSRFSRWRSYEHRVGAHVDGRVLPFPINVDTINKLYNLNLEAHEMASFLERVRVKLERIENSRDSVVSRVGTELYEKFFKNYTAKQWGIPAEELHPSVCERIPIRFDRDDRYFTDRYQGVPLDGYRRLFENMLDHPNIRVLLQTSCAEIADQVVCDALVYTGPIDEYFSYCHGRLEYRSLRFEFKNLPVESFQDYAVVNYPNDYDFTRITEYKRITGQKADSTTISYEYPRSEGDPYYPMPTAKNQERYAKYEEEARKLKDVIFAGRLGSYRYLNMDAACLEGMKVAERILR